jgi:hypothetical protein
VAHNAVVSMCIYSIVSRAYLGPGKAQLAVLLHSQLVRALPSAPPRNGRRSSVCSVCLAVFVAASCLQSIDDAVLGVECCGSGGNCSAVFDCVAEVGSPAA